MQQAGHVCEDHLPVGVLGGEFVQIRQQWRCPEGVDTGVDLADAQLFWCERLLLDDSVYFSRHRRKPYDAPVAGGVGGSGGQDSHRRLLGLVELPKLLNGLGPDEGHVAREH